MIRIPSAWLDLKLVVTSCACRLQQEGAEDEKADPQATAAAFGVLLDIEIKALVDINTPDPDTGEPLLLKHVSGAGSSNLCLAVLGLSILRRKRVAQADLFCVALKTGHFAIIFTPACRCAHRL